MRALGLASLLLAGCTMTPPSTTPASSRAGTCDAAAAQRLVGQAGTAAVMQEALRLSGARDLRTIRPGMAVTMDYREDRVNVELDARERVTAIRCG